MVRLELNAVARPIRLLAGDYRVRFIKPCAREMDIFHVPEDSFYDATDPCS
jgi:hypothetical protein